MLGLASMIMAAFFWCHSQMGAKNVPMPVVISTDNQYSYSEIYEAIYVPANWQGTCYNQKQVIMEMLEHFNSQLNGNQRKSEDKLFEIRDKWQCVQ